MDITTAIKILQDFRIINPGQDYPDFDQALHLAILALHEKLERENGGT